jgi:hypothetical protein
MEKVFYHDRKVELSQSVPKTENNRNLPRPTVGTRHERIMLLLQYPQAGICQLTIQKQLSLLIVFCLLFTQKNVLSFT